MDSKELVPANTFEMVERADEQAVLDEIKGRAMDALVYEFRQGGQVVTGLSLSGVRETARLMNANGKARIGVSEREPVIAETDDYYEVKVYAQDAMNGGGYWGLKRQPKKYSDGKANGFALEQALAKAQRNALRGLIPEWFTKEMINAFRAQRSVKTLGDAPKQKPQEAEPGNGNDHTTESAVKPQRPYTPSHVRAALQSRVEHFNRTVSEETLKKMRGLLAGTLNTMVGGDDRRHWLLAALWPESEGHSDKMTVAQVSVTLDWCSLEKTSAGEYLPTPNTKLAEQEAAAIITEYQKEHGQSELPMT